MRAAIQINNSTINSHYWLLPLTLRAAIQCKLIFLDFPHFQIFSWWSCQLLESHPSIIMSLCCLPIYGPPILSEGVSCLAQWFKCSIIAFWSLNFVPSSFIHLLSFWVVIHHCVLALGAGHQSIRLLSSVSVWQWGHCAIDNWPCLTIFFHEQNVFCNPMTMSRCRFAKCSFHCWKVKFHEWQWCSW